MRSSPAEELKISASIIEGCPVDAHPDGSRFIGVRRTAFPTTRTLLFVENWFEEFRRR